MIDDLNIENILELIDPAKIRVYQPTKIIFICGGKTCVEAHPPMSLRDAFMRIAYSKPFERYKPILAEELNAFFPYGNYKDFLSLEKDIAQISALILLFSETFGSAAELGAFAMMNEIAQRLLVVIDDKHYEENSFIKLGPLRALEIANGDGCVCVVNLKDLGIEKIDSLKNLNVDYFSKIIQDAVLHRERSIPEHSTFNPDLSGHIIKLIVGLIQWYGALTVDEIETALYCLNVNCVPARIHDFLLCAQFAQWITPKKRGVQTFHVAKSDTMAVQFTAREGKKMVNRLRWQAEIRAYWKANDDLRFRSISDVMNEA
ncbi:retron St85 family effector protein [Rhizobium anhuiense]|uniref:retron St85 family effector protein n=1 Tax=Rhizobium anhuiense TaxID=1184720 RepID=UPI000F78EE6D|nr:retron St85 family effector protein [Rhizobium anhuiense]